MDTDKAAEEILKAWPKDTVFRELVKALILEALDVGYYEGFADGRVEGWDACADSEDRR